MQATPDQKKGSFGLPKGMQETLNAQEEKKIKEEAAKVSPRFQPTAESTAPAAPSIDDLARAEKEIFDQQVLKEKLRLRAAVDQMEERLGITIGNQDLLDMVRKGRITKNPVTIVKGYLDVGFRTLTGGEVQAIEEHMYEVRKTSTHTSQSIENEEVFWKLAYGLASYQGKDTSAVKDKSKIRSQLTQLSATTIDRLNKAYIDFNNLINLKMEDPEYIKK